jgi:hypothetical protein
MPGAIQTQKEERAILLHYFNSYWVRESCDFNPTKERDTLKVRGSSTHPSNGRAKMHHGVTGRGRYGTALLILDIRFCEGLGGLLVGYPGGITTLADKPRNADFIVVSAAVRSVP